MNEHTLTELEGNYPPGGAVHALVAEVRRLRALIKSAEFSAQYSIQGNDGYETVYHDCPWCGSEQGSRHQVGCEVFTVDGQVK